MCGDAIRRLLFLRVFTYSADYPERSVHRDKLSSLSHPDRAMIATIRMIGKAACPQDICMKHILDLLGTAESRQIIASKIRKDGNARRRLVKAARDFIYENGLGVKSREVEKRLAAQSWTPTLVRTTQITVLF